MDIDNYYKLIFTDYFLNELEIVNNYWFNDLYSQRMAKEIMNKIDDILVQISMFPKSCKRIENTPYRKALIKNYIIIYGVNDKKKKVYILHIFHSKSDYQRKLNSKFF